jgi:hypothetical protein
LLAALPRVSFAVVSADKELLLNEKNYCVAGASVKNFWEYNEECVSIVAEFEAGCDADITSGLHNKDNWVQNDKIQSTNNALVLDKALAILSLSSVTDADCDLAIGYNKNWSTFCDPRTYVGCGFKGFSNPFILDKDGFGVGINYEVKGLNCFANIRNSKKNASQVETGVSTRGFLNSDTPAQCDIGVCYNLKGKVEAGVLCVCSQYNVGAADETRIGTLVGEDDNSITINAKSALQQSLGKDKKLTLLTSACSSELQPGVSLDCAIACANLKDGTNNKGRVLKWSAGCSSLCKPLHIKGKKVFGVEAYGCHVGTPTYLQEEYDSTAKDETPLVCELSCVANFCGLTLPIYLDYMSKHEGTNAATKGSFCVLGVKAENYWGFRCGPDGDAQCFTEKPCPEGGDEDEE